MFLLILIEKLFCKTNLKLKVLKLINKTEYCFVYWLVSDSINKPIYTYLVVNEEVERFIYIYIYTSICRIESLIIVIFRQSLLKVCKWVLRNSNWDSVSLETIMRFKGYEGLRVFHFLIIILVLKVYEGFEGKYLTSSCIYYWFRTLNGWRTLNTTYTRTTYNCLSLLCVLGLFRLLAWGFQHNERLVDIWIIYPR